MSLRTARRWLSTTTTLQLHSPGWADGGRNLQWRRRLAAVQRQRQIYGNADGTRDLCDAVVDGGIAGDDRSFVGAMTRDAPDRLCAPGAVDFLVLGGGP